MNRKSMIILRQAQNDVVNSRLRTIKDEINRVSDTLSAEERETTIQEIYANIMKPVVCNNNSKSNTKNQ